MLNGFSVVSHIDVKEKCTATENYEWWEIRSWIMEESVYLNDSRLPLPFQICPGVSKSKFWCETWGAKTMMGKSNYWFVWLFKFACVNLLHSYNYFSHRQQDLNCVRSQVPRLVSPKQLWKTPWKSSNSTLQYWLSARMKQGEQQTDSTAWPMEVTITMEASWLAITTFTGATVTIQWTALVINIKLSCGTRSLKIKLITFMTSENLSLKK